MSKKEAKPKGPNLFGVLKPYRRQIVGLVILSLVMNSISLVIPRIISAGIDAFVFHRLDVQVIAWEFLAAMGGVFVFSFGLSYLQTYASERVARDLRTQLAERISRQNYSFLQKTNSAQLLTNLTSDVDSIKMFVSQAFVSIFSSAFVILG